MKWTGHWTGLRNFLDARNGKDFCLSAVLVWDWGEGHGPVELRIIDAANYNRWFYRERLFINNEEELANLKLFAECLVREAGWV